MASRLLACALGAAALAASLGIVAGCSTLPEPLAGRAAGGPAWTEVRSDHFVLRTDLDGASAQLAIAGFERIHAAFRTLGFADADAPRRPIDVVLFREADPDLPVAADHLGGAFVPTGWNDVDQTPTILLHGDWLDATRASFAHELTHAFVRTAFPQAPVWLDEGLAEDFATIAFDPARSRAVAGRPPVDYYFAKDGWLWHDSPYGARMRVPVFEATPVKALVAMNYATFHRTAVVVRNENQAISEYQRQIGNFGSAWGLVRVFLNDAAWKPKFASYVARLRAGENADDAFRATFTAADLDALDAAMRRSVVAPDVPVRWAKVDPGSRVSAPRLLSDEEVLLLGARFRDWSTSEGRQRAAAQVEAARRLAPSSPEVARLRGMLAQAAGDPLRAEAELRRAVGDHPDDLRAWTLLGQVRLARIQAGAATGAGAPSLDAIATHLAAAPTTPAQLDLLAYVEGTRGAYDAGLAYEREALRLDPGCWQCLTTSASLLDAQGNLGAAAAAQASALERVPEGRKVPELEQALAVYRRRLAESATR